MSTLREPSLGPIVGHTTHQTCRIWMRGVDPVDPKVGMSEDLRTIGVISVVGKGGKAVPAKSRRVYYFRLHREYDRTGTFTLGADSSFRLATSAQATDPLEPDTEYEVRVGSLAIDDAIDNDARVPDDLILKRLPDPLVWYDSLLKLDPARSTARFRTFPEDTAQRELSFLLGSCRYPGLFWKRKLADQIFGTMMARIEAEPSIRFTLMVGDQIYADMFNRLVPIGLADTFEEFQERYHSAFGSLHMRRLLRSQPTYMILDDHEIEDNWTQDRLRDHKKRIIFNLAIDAYRSYQWSHSPRPYPDRLFYSFSCGGYPFFVIDGRTQRCRGIDSDLSDNHMLGRPSFPGDPPSQLEYLCEWLVAQQNTRGNVPKFLVSPSVFVPNDITTIKSDRHKDRDDSWPAFPNTRRALLECIVRNEIQNVVFLSGDIHCSNVAEIFFGGTPEAARLKAFSVTSSAFYWPFPFADGDPAGYVHDSRDPETPDTFAIRPAEDLKMDYRSWNFTQEDNFCQIRISRESASLEVRAYDRSGAIIRVGNNDLVATLQLVPWQ